MLLVRFVRIALIQLNTRQLGSQDQSAVYPAQLCTPVKMHCGSYQIPMHNSPTEESERSAHALNVADS